MVDFKKLRASKPKPVLIHPREIFNALPKPPGINDLYASQAEVLDAWFERRTETDTVVKLHTGGGKTLVALLMAQSVMNETREPVLYLAPTNQLVEQVLAKSEVYGIAALPYTKGEPFPSDFHDGKSVLVGAYQTLFNGRSKFGVLGSGQQIANVGAIVLDDAHVALSSVRDAFTLTVSAQHQAHVYIELADRFRHAFKQVGRNGIFSDIISGKEYGIVEVPSWAWNQQHDEVQQYLADKVKDIDPFIWPFLRDNLDSCHCLFSKTAVCITPIFPLVDLLPTFDACPRRIYMSATIADDSEILRTFSASRRSIAKPITSESLAGVGERMILVPGLMNLGATPIIPMAKHIALSLADDKLGVVILSPSRTAAKQWRDIADSPPNSSAVSSLIAAMQEGETYGPIVLANRYDGIDLASDACRFLIMDGLPRGTSNYDVFRMNVVADAAVNSLLAQRIEQGIGRGTRGGADFCVIVMVGSNLVAWIGRKKNLDYLTASTRVQLKMGQEVSAAVTTQDEIDETIQKCLIRDPDWVAYHASELSDAAHAAPLDILALKTAAAEREAFKFQRLRQYDRALSILEKQMDADELASNPQHRAWLAAAAARIAYQTEDNAQGQRFETIAYTLNSNHSPPRARPKYVVRIAPGEQSRAIVKRLLEYDQPAAILAEFDDATSNLVPEASALRYEEALAGLGSFLGFDAERPEDVHGVGPDVLWRTHASFDFVIEAKSRKDPENPLYKKDHAQLLEAEHWFKQHYPDREAIRVSALPEPFADDKATPAGTFALRLDDITKVSGALRRLLQELAWAGGNLDSLRERCESLIRNARLTPSLLKNTYLKPFTKTTTNNK